MFTHGETVTLHKYTLKGTNAHGQETYGFVDQKIDNVAVFSGTTNEVTDGNGVRLSTGIKLIIEREDIVVTSKDKVTVRGFKYDVDGNSSGVRVNPFTGTSFGTRIQLRRTTGG